jgi:succinyl-diaminopimelate desuccinylase
VLRHSVALVRLRSVWDEANGGNEAAAAAYVARELTWRWVSRSTSTRSQRDGPTWSPTGPAAGFVVGRDRTLMLEGHTDVVTEGDVARWSRDPFGAELSADPPAAYGSTGAAAPT